VLSPQRSRWGPKLVDGAGNALRGFWGLRERVLLHVRHPLRPEVGQEPVDLACVEAAGRQVGVGGFQLFQDPPDHSLVLLGDLSQLVVREREELGTVASGPLKGNEGNLAAG
jgi:hypothetical protein